MGEFHGIGLALRHLRQQKGLLQKDVASGSGVSKTLISGYETGSTEPTLTSLSRILETLELDRFDLLNALEMVNGRPQREFPICRGEKRPPGTAVIDALGVRDLDPQEEEDFLRMLDGFRGWFEHCRSLVRRMGP